ncbi:MAG TPA: 30S ribosome-binding factor RbfA [Candidatus Omnitrophota bacterium]|nr:30S ribosome-binding factor RbfA [Candidatus Omnitrophota bacterium]
MLGGKRTERIGEQIKEEMGRIVLLRLKDPRLGFVTITHVEMSADLKYAKVFYSVMGSPEACANTAKALESARGYLQREISKTLKLRLTPMLQFYLDDSIAHGLQIESIIKKIHEERPGTGPSEDEHNG